MQIDTRVSPFKVSNTTNVNGGSITFPLPTTTQPSGDGVLDNPNLSIAPVGALASNGVMIVPFGTGSAAQTFTMSVYGWRPTVGKDQLSRLPLWVACEFCNVTCTLSTVPGVAQTDVNASQLFAGTITINRGNANVSVESVSPTGNIVAHLIVDVKGSPLTEVRFAIGTNTDCNCLYARL